MDPGSSLIPSEGLWNESRVYKIKVCSMAGKDRSKRWQGMCWRVCEMEFEFEGRVDGWMQGVSGMREVETDFRNLRMNVRFDGRKKEIRSRSSFERDD